MIRKSNLLLLFALLIFIFLESSQVAFTFIDGPPAGYTGEISELSCGDGAGCHGGTPSANPNIADIIISDASGNIVSDYIPGDTYTITVDINGAPVGGCYGFQILNLDSTGTTVGNFNSIAGTSLVTSGLRMYIQHTVPRTSGNWVFTWTAPVLNVGPIDWFMGANVANCNNSSSGDLIYTATKTLTAPNCPLDFSLVLLQPNSLFFECDYSTDAPRLRVKISNFSGPGAPYTLSSNGGDLSCTIAYPGDTIDYYFSEYELDNGLTYIFMDNSAGICAPFNYVESAFQGFPMDFFCTEPLQCNSNIIATYSTTNNAQAVLNCNSSNTMLELEVSSVTGGSGSYTIISQGGTVSPSVLSSGQGFTYSISQSNINALNTVLLIDDGNGCTETIDLKGSVLGSIISDICPACQNSIDENLQEPILQDRSANISITSNGYVAPNKDILYQAGSYVELAPHFEVKLGAEFDAIIGPCN